MGRKQFEMIVASAPRESMVVTNNQYDGVVVPSGGSVAFDIYAPAGTIGDLVKCNIMQDVAPSSSGATSGEHQVILSHTNTNGSIISAVYPFDKRIIFTRNYFENDPSAYAPPDYAALVESVKDVPFDNVIGLTLYYYNHTNAAVTFDFSWHTTWMMRTLA